MAREQKSSGVGIAPPWRLGMAIAVIASTAVLGLASELPPLPAAATSAPPAFPFGETFEPIYDGRGVLQGWHRFTVDHEYRDLDLSSVESWLRNQPLQMQIMGNHPSGSAELHSEAYGDMVDHWLRISQESADEIAKGGVREKHFEPFLAEWQHERRRWHAYMTLLYEKSNRHDFCRTARPVPDWAIPDPRDPQRDAATLDDYCQLRSNPVWSHYYSERFWEAGRDPWAFMDEVAATSRPGPLRVPRDPELTFIERTTGEERPIEGQMHFYGGPILIEARYEEEQEDPEIEITLEWTTRAGAESMVLIATQSPSDAKVYRTEEFFIMPEWHDEPTGTGLVEP